MGGRVHRSRRGRIEDALGKTDIKNFLPIQPGDVPGTLVDVQELWYRDYHGV